MEDTWKTPDEIAKRSKEDNERIDYYFHKLIPILRGTNITGTAPPDLAIIKCAKDSIDEEGKEFCSEVIKKKVRLMKPATLPKDVEEIIALIDKEMGLKK